MIGGGEEEEEGGREADPEPVPAILEDPTTTLAQWAGMLVELGSERTLATFDKLKIVSITDDMEKANAVQLSKTWEAVAGKLLQMSKELATWTGRGPMVQPAPEFVSSARWTGAGRLPAMAAAPVPIMPCVDAGGRPAASSPNYVALIRFVKTVCNLAGIAAVAMFNSDFELFRCKAGKILLSDVSGAMATYTQETFIELRNSMGGAADLTVEDFIFQRSPSVAGEEVGNIFPGLVSLTVEIQRGPRDRTSVRGLDLKIGLRQVRMANFVRMYSYDSFNRQFTRN